MQNDWKKDTGLPLNGLTSVMEDLGAQHIERHQAVRHLTQPKPESVH